MPIEWTFDININNSHVWRDMPYNERMDTIAWIALLAFEGMK